ncbi:Na+/H+ antiporter subunit E [Candidatus Bipolaricaulota bacterium]|nr:Na+/H+ antiporter subunit E [Candidatus Bipolaricaulota bacterium]
MSIAFLLCMWIALAQRVGGPTLIAGAAAAVVVWSIRRLLFPAEERGVRGLPLWKRLWAAQAFLVTLLHRFVASTLRTSWLILSGGEEGRVVAVPTRIQHPTGKFLLQNSITLTPSTISLVSEGGLLYIHWLQRHGSSGDWQQVKEALERRVEAMFEEDRPPC